jgi:hypothetical protein
MHQVKIFKGLESDLAALERQINGWIATEAVQVINIFGNIAPQSQPPNEKGAALASGAFAASDVLDIVHYSK